MKFQVEVSGKDGVAEGISEACVKERERVTGREYSAEFDGDSDPGYYPLRKKLEKLVHQFVQDGEGGNDSVVLEFDTETKSCTVVPRKKVKK